MSSIDHGHERETAELPAEQTGVEGDAGSDTDTGRTVTSDTAIQDVSDGKHHARSNSVKKPTIFKAVSVTKNFLAKAGSPTPPHKGNGDKAPSTTTASGNASVPAPRPRLVAKSASGHQTSTPKSMNSASKNGNGSGPDPNQVWNRNRPVPQAPPKHFTDEELKQQYGIHLATRLQADGDGKEAKWADIDDDEDDWAPETIEWNDGTKITLSHNDPAAVRAEEQAAALALKEQQEEQNKAKMPPPKPTTTVGPNATVLRLGSSGPPRTGGLVLKNPSDKPTLVAKPSAPALVRSPWAQLPPVDKVPPVPINPPLQSSASRPQPADSHASDGTPTPTSTAMEIAADSFTRTRRDVQNGSHGQLYNSQSGQYETVNTPRRGSMRKEQNFRPPSLLQRPPNNEQHGPAEPSAAFQTHRSGGQQDGSTWNRRTSSTLSGDSGPQGRRASMSKGTDVPRIPHEFLEQRRESQPLQSPSTPGPGQGRFTQQDNAPAPTQSLQPSSQFTAPMNSQQAIDANASTSTPQTKPIPYGSSAASRTQNDVAAQRQLMREKRELAVKRKKEEEEKEEAERKERIRLRMEKLGLPPLVEKKETEKTVPEKKEAESKEVETIKAESTDVGLKGAKPENPQTLAQPPEVSTSTPRSPPKPPVLDASGAPKQYGLMKMHGPALSNGIQPSSERHITDTQKAAGSSQQLMPPGHEATVKENQPSSSPKANGDICNKQVDSHITPSPKAPSQDLFKAPRPQPWKNIHNDTDSFASWNGAGMTTHSSPVGNLWGPPTNFKSLGNGTFDRSVQRPQSRQPPYQDHYMQPPPQPIGPPKHLQRPRQSPEPARAQDLISPAPVAEDSQTIPTFPSSDAPSTSFVNRGNMTNQNGSGETPVLPSQTPPEKQTKPEVDGERPSRSQDPPRSTLAAWGNFHITSAREEAETRRQAAQEHAARLAEEARTGIRHEPQLPVMNETWRQLKVDDNVGRRQVIGVSKNAHESIPDQQVSGDIRNSPFANQPNATVAAGVGRGSRFFPGPGQAVQAQAQRAVSQPVGFNRPVSPPPPESANHPAYIRTQQRPLVNLPSPKPTVRLPPSSATPVYSPVLAEVPIVPLRAVSQPLVNNPSWQDRFNGLLGKKPSPDKKFALVAEFSATTKVPLEVPTVQVSAAAVSLPAKEEEAIQLIDSGEVTSKATEDEEALFENRAFGSLPTVLIPSNAPEAVPLKNGKVQSRGLPRTKEVDPQTVKNLEDKENEISNGIVIFIKLIGMEGRKSKTLPRLKGYAPNQGAPRNNRHPSTNSKPGKGYKPRESSGSYNGPQKSAQPNTTQRNSMPNGVNPQTRSQFGKHNPNWNASQRVANPVQ